MYNYFLLQNLKKHFQFVNHACHLREKNIERNKDKIKIRTKEFREINRDKINIKKKKYRESNKKKIKQYTRQYYQENKNKMKKYNIEYKKQRKKIDPDFKLNTEISKTIAKVLKKQKSSKNNKSCLKYLPYSIQELKDHLEKQFEPWMTWEKWGAYKSDDYPGDSSTWKWQIDHIIPQSVLPYTSMNDNNFKKCWALENLRPLRADINHHEGINRIRHVTSLLV